MQYPKSIRYIFWYYSYSAQFWWRELKKLSSASGKKSVILDNSIKKKKHDI